MIEEVRFSGKLYAIIIWDVYDEPGIHFVTPNDFSPQLSFMHHHTGHKIRAHIHKRFIRKINYTQEVIVIKRGVLRVDFYNDDEDYLESRRLKAGDVILLADGGHGFEVLEEDIRVDVKQVP